MSIPEGSEYEIIRLPDNRIIYSGIADYDGEAEEKLEAYALHFSAVNRSTHTITFQLRKLN